MNFLKQALKQKNQKQFQLYICQTNKVQNCNNILKSLTQKQANTFINNNKKQIQIQQQQLLSHVQHNNLSHVQLFNFSYQQQQNSTQLTQLQNALKEIYIGDQLNLWDEKVLVFKQIDTESGKVVLKLRLDSNYRKVKQLIQDKLNVELPWIKELEISLAPKDQEPSFDKKFGLKNVKNLIAVSSCKGGVGKSTVSINLAFSLLKKGKKVGIFDADIFGPSLPTLINKEMATLKADEENPKNILPIEYEGIKTMSYGFVNKEKSILRGPLVSSIVSQLIYQTQWGDLDYLIVDMPPGTGDIQITICQELALNAAVIVTTPQRLSFVDVVKGIQMFDDLKVPTISVIENMSEYICENCNHEHKLFGHGYLNLIKKQYGIKNSFGIPLMASISKSTDTGRPIVLELPEDHTISQLYSQIADTVDREVISLESQKIPIVRYQTGTQEVIVQEDGTSKIYKKMKAKDLRKKCQCALCIDEFTGKQLRDDSKISEDVYPHKIETKGNYAVAIRWSDGHQSSIYPYEYLMSLDI